MTVSEIKKMFLDIYGGTEDDLRVFASPGRVNLIGEHTDYNGGYVFPAALKMRTTIVLRPNGENIVRMAATDLPDRVSVDISKIEDYKDLKWGDYQAGIISEMLKDNYDIVGCDMLYDDTTPHGGGLSSSAAIEVSTALAFATLHNEKNGITEPVNMIEMAKIGQRAENVYIGVNCGIMDQFASAMGKEDHAIFLQCQSLDYKHVPVKLDGKKIVVSNTKKKHSLGASKYNERRGECEEGLKALQTVIPGIEQLVDVTPEQFEEHKDVIKNEVVRRRIKHVVGECARVKKSVVAMKSNDIEEFGRLMNGSHDSLQYDYEVTCPELDFVVQEGRKLEGVLGIRMTGAGFGGCTVAIIKDEKIDEYIEKVGKAYVEKFGHEASFFVTEVGDGGREVK